MSIEHSDISFGEMHPVANWVLTSGGVAALGSIAVSDADIGKVAWVAGAGHFVLAAVAPTLWETLGLTLSSAVYADQLLTLTFSDNSTVDVEILSMSAEQVQLYVEGVLANYATGSALTNAIDTINTALGGKEPAIAAGSNSQYYRGDKTWQVLNTGAVTESTDLRYLSDAQKARVTSAANTSTDGYLTSTDWNTFNGKQNALADVITANTYGSSTQYPVVTVTAKGIVTGITLQTVPTPTFTDANFSVQKAGSPSIAASWDLTALTVSAVHTYPNKDINFKALSSIGASDSNALSGTRNRILGGSNTVVAGTDNIAIGCKGFVMAGEIYTSCTMIGSNPASISAATKNIMLGMRNSHMQTAPVTGSLFLGASDNPDLFTYPVAAATVMNSLFASSDSVPVSGTLYATTNGSQTLSAANCLPIPISCGTAQYEVDFIVSVGTVGLASTACNAKGCIVMRRIFTVFKFDPFTAYISAVDTVGTDRTLGIISGTFTPVISLASNTHVTVGITRAGGVAEQEAMAISARVRAHLTR